MRLLFTLRGWIRILLIAAVVALVLTVGLWAALWLQDWRAVLILVGAAVVLAFLGGRARRYVPRRTILEVDLERGVVERAPDGLLESMRPDRPVVLKDLVDALDRAAADRRVVGLVARVGAFQPGLAVAQEIRDALLAFRKKGKHAVAWAETFGEGGSTTVEVYLASAFDEVFVQPTGEVGLDGVLYNHPFVRGTLDKVGIEAQMENRREYKAAKYLFTEREMIEPHKESAQSLLDSQVSQIVEGIAQARNMTPERVRALIDEGPFVAGKAKEAGLIDGIAYRDEVYEQTKTTFKGRFLYLERYLRRAGRPQTRGKTIVVIPGLGAIARGRGKPRRGRSGGTFGSDDVAAAIRKAAKSKRVKAIVLRVDSPGGSAVASDVVHRAVTCARESGTPVVASMGNVAASGGYYVSCGADRIVAQPGTITGSIGVVWGKFYVREAYRKLGITWDSLQVGEHADLWSGTHPLNEKGWARVNELIDAVYEDFKTRVAAGRDMTLEEVEAVAKGRVWTGEQAKANGLVDELGGLDVAVSEAKAAAGIEADAKVRLKTVLPTRRRPPWKARESSEALAAAGEAAAALAPVVELLRPRGRLEMPPLDVSTGI